jgi:hypothetical protein
MVKMRLEDKCDKSVEKGNELNTNLRQPDHNCQIVLHSPVIGDYDKVLNRIDTRQMRVI